MPQETRSLLAFNRGIVSELGLARVDLTRIALAAETQHNWMPRVLGSMMLRPGWRYTGTMRGNALGKLFPFVFARDDTAELELTDSILRIRIVDDLITRIAVSAAITNGTFTTNLTGWTDSDEVGAASAWVTGGYMGLLGDGTNAAIRDQQVTVTEVGTEHALRIVIARGPVMLRVGSSTGDDDYLEETTLGTGTHSLALTASGNFFIRLMSRGKYTSLVDSVAVEAAGTLELPTPWPASVLALIRMDQSADVLFAACKGYQQRRIERRGARSWSIVLYEPDAPPFRPANTTPVKIDANDTRGDVTLTASQPLFKSANVGSAYRIRSVGQLVRLSISSDNTFTDPIRVVGIGSQRTFNLIAGGALPFVATITLQYSAGEPGSWVDVTSYTSLTSTTYNDGFDNQVIYYRLGIKTGDYTSGAPITTQLSYTAGSITGIARVTAYTSQTVVSAVVLRELGGGPGSSDWDESLWSDRRGWPSAVALYESRLWWPGKQYNVGSVTDEFDNFDNETVGDAGPIIRSIGSGPIDTVSWMLPVSRLLLGSAGAEYAIRSSSLDEPVTPANYNIKPTSTQGSAAINAVRVDENGLYVQAGLERVYMLEAAANVSATDYNSVDLMQFVPDLCALDAAGGIVHIAVQRKPDTRLHVIRADGTVAVLVFDRVENVTCWVTLDTAGVVEDAVVLPGNSEDRVTYVVRRTIHGATVRYRETWALESECQGGTLNKQADAFVLYSGAASTTLTGLDHLEGESVVVWGNGKDLGTFTVASGAITGLSESVTSAVVGLTYTARYQSAKQAFAAAMGSALNRQKRIPQVGFILASTHAKGLRYGPDFDNLDELPDVEEETAVASDSVWDAYDKEYLEFPGDWDTDARVCLEASAPRPVTVLCCSVDLTTHG